MRIFTHLRKMLIDNQDLRLEIDDMKSQLTSNAKNMKAIFGYLDQLLAKDMSIGERKHIGYKSFENKN